MKVKSVKEINVQNIDVYDIQVESEHSFIVEGVVAHNSAICRSLDGLEFTLDYKPVGHDQSFMGGPPYHWRCRTTIGIITKSWAELSGPKSKMSNRKIREIERNTTPVQRGAMGGKVKGDMTYNAWLKTQSAKVQVDVLGKTKRELWLQDKLTMQDMVNQYGRPLTIKQLETKYGKLQK